MSAFFFVGCTYFNRSHNEGEYERYDACFEVCIVNSLKDKFKSTWCIFVVGLVVSRTRLFEFGKVRYSFIETDSTFLECSLHANKSLTLPGKL